MGRSVSLHATGGGSFLQLSGGERRAATDRGTDPGAHSAAMPNCRPAPGFPSFKVPVPGKLRIHPAPMSAPPPTIAPGDPGPPPIPRRWHRAAWGWLLLTLASGVLLRWGWTGQGAGLLPVDARFLLHAHSHVALLGWIFVGFFAFILPAAPWAGGDRPSARVRAAEGAFHLGVGAMFLAFLLQGYAAASITLSMLHLVVAVGLVVYWMRRLRQVGVSDGGPHGADHWILPALGLFLLANLGPWMLALGGRMGEGWTEAWVGFYLALLFHGWIGLGVPGLLVARLGVALPRGAGRLILLGALPSVLPRMTGILPRDTPGGEVAAWVGWGGSVALGAGLAWVGVALLQAEWKRGRDGPGVRKAPLPTAVRLLLLSVGGAAVLAGMSVAVGSAPGLAPTVMAGRNLVVGYVHLLLLGYASAALLALFLAAEGSGGATASGSRIPPVGSRAAPLESPTPSTRQTLGVALFLAGGWGMVLLLLGVGGAALVGRFAFWPVQETLTWAGVVALAGGVLLAPGGRVPHRLTNPGAPPPAPGPGGRGPRP
jgi:hypothetical protein